METLEFERLLLGRVALDFCFACQLVWFDEHESTQLAPGGIIEVFKAFDAHRAPTRNPLPELLDCPRCNSRLSLTHDLQRTTHFTYYRCDWGHGRLTPFVQFLLEKNFVRPMSGSELATLKARVRSVQCSNCGAPIDLVNASECAHCGTPISMLDVKQIEAAVTSLQRADEASRTIDPSWPLRIAREKLEVDRVFAALRAEGGDSSSGVVEMGLRLLTKFFP